MRFILKFYNFIESKWLDDLKKFEQFHEIWSYESSGFAKKSLVEFGNASELLWKRFVYKIVKYQA